MLPPLAYEPWKATCDTLHAYTQILGKLAVALAPPEPQLQHAALRLTARGWETLPLSLGPGSVVAALDLRSHEAVVEHSGGGDARFPLGGPVADVMRDILSAVGDVEIDPTPQEVAWTVPLDQDTEHATYDADQVADFFRCATEAALALAEFRAPFRGRSTPVNAWWGSFDLATNLFSGESAEPPSDDFIMRNSMDSQEVAVGWWPGDPRYDKAAFYAYAHPAPAGYEDADLHVAGAHWGPELGLYLLDWEDVRNAEDPRGLAVEFARSAFRHACIVCDWDPVLADSAHGSPPPVS
jgi:hypothetical protein